MRLKGLLLVAAFMIVGFVFANFYMDSFVKSNIESIGSDIAGAKVSLDSIDISIKKQSVTIKGLQVADRKAPMTNIMQLASMNFDFSLPDLLMGSLIIENVSVDTPLFGTKRQTSGALPQQDKRAKRGPKEPEGVLTKKAKSVAGAAADKVKAKAEELADAKTGGLTSELKKGVDWNRYLPSTKDMENFDASKLVNSETMASIRKLEETSKFAEGRDIYWKDRYKQLEGEYKLLKKGAPPANKTGEVVKYLKRLDDFSKELKAGKKEFRSDIKRLEAAGKKIKRLKNQDLKNALNIPGLASGNISQISQSLFEEIYRDKIEALLDRFGIYKSALEELKSSGDEDEEKKRMQGETVHYPLRNPLPRFHLKKATFNIAADARKGNWFSGLVKDVTSDPLLTGKATTVDLEAGAESYPGALFSVRGKAEYPGKVPLYSVNIEGKNISTKLAAESLGKGSPLAIKGGSLQLKSQFSLEGDRIKSDFIIALEDIEMSARRDGLKDVDPALLRLLDDSVKEVSTISLKGEARGTTDKMKVRISSDLDKILEKVFAKMVAAAGKEMEVRIREELNKEIEKKLPGLQSMLKDDSGNFKSLEDALKAELKKEKKKSRKKLQNEVEKNLKKLLKF